MGPVERYSAIMADLTAKQANAARRNKPTMWAYFYEMRLSLGDWFSTVDAEDGSYAGAALTLSQQAERQCADLSPGEAARLWALGIYARRILSAWFDKELLAKGEGASYRVSLSWLHERAEEAP